jgi:hypothetical protein
LALLELVLLLLLEEVEVLEALLLLLLLLPVEVAPKNSWDNKLEIWASGPLVDEVDGCSVLEFDLEQQ